MLYLVTDARACAPRSVIEVVAEAVAGGVSVVQLREKGLPDRELLRISEDLREITSRAGIPLIMNDRADLALLAQADGVHLGQDDLPLPLARRILGSGAIIGISTHDPEEARAAEREGALYAGIGAFAATSTKADARSPGGVELVKRVRAAVGLPLVAIGGINAANAAAAVLAGADAVAVASAVMGAADPQAAAAEILGIVREARRERERRGTGK